MTEKDLMIKFLKKRGWSTYYDDAYWINEKTVEDHNSMDYTNYGMDLHSAFVHEVENLPAFKSMRMHEVSKNLHEVDVNILDYYFKE